MHGEELLGTLGFGRRTARAFGEEEGARRASPETQRAQQFLAMH
jgi:hypothetical protein